MRRIEIKPVVRNLTFAVGRKRLVEVKCSEVRKRAVYVEMRASLVRMKLLAVCKKFKLRAIVGTFNHFAAAVFVCNVAYKRPYEYMQ